MKKTSRRGIDVDVEELDRLIDSTEQGPLSEADRRKLKTAVHAMAERLVRRQNTEKVMKQLLENQLSIASILHRAIIEHAGRAAYAVSRLTDCGRSDHAVEHDLPGPRRHSA